MSLVDEYNSSPSEAFNNFSYDVAEETIDDLRQDVIVLDESVKNGLITQGSKPSTSELAIRNMYEEFGDKLGMKVGYTDFREYISHIAENNKVQRDIIEAVNAKLAMDISQRAIAKLLVTFNTLIDRSTAMILRMTEGVNAEFTPELVGMADKCMTWLQQLLLLKNEAMERMPDPDRTIDKTVLKQKGLENKDKEKHTEKDAAIINDLLTSIRSEY